MAEQNQPKPNLSAAINKSTKYKCGYPADGQTEPTKTKSQRGYKSQAIALCEHLNVTSMTTLQHDETPVRPGLGRIAALHRRSSTAHQSR